MSKYNIMIGNDGKHYAVFKDAIEAENAAKEFIGCRIACFNGYDNAYELPSSWNNLIVTSVVI